MDEIHDVILIAIIGAIILVQVLVFVGNYRKIKDYKKTIETAQDFKIVEVAVPEEWIKEVEVDEILRNPEAFQDISSEFSSKTTEAPEKDIEAFSEKDETYEPEEKFQEEIEFPNVTELNEDEEDFEYEEYKNKKI